VCTKAQPGQKSAILGGGIFRFFPFFLIFSRKLIVFFSFLTQKIFGCALLERPKEAVSREKSEARRRFSTADSADFHGKSRVGCVRESCHPRAGGGPFFRNVAWPVPTNSLEPQMDNDKRG